MKKTKAKDIALDSPLAFFNRELSWLAFARRVLAQVQDPDLPLYERINFAGIMGILHDDFFMKRIGGLKRQMQQKPHKISNDGRTPEQEFKACFKEIVDQMGLLEKVINEDLRPALAEAGSPIIDHEDLTKQQKSKMREFFRKSVLPMLTPLGVDTEHPFPFVSSLGLNLAVIVPGESGEKDRFIRVKIPKNRPRWVPLADGKGFVPLEQVISANFELLTGGIKPKAVYCFRVTRGADSYKEPNFGHALHEPGAIVRLVTFDLKARRFAGVVRIKVDNRMPRNLRKWLARMFEVTLRDVYRTSTFLGLNDLVSFPGNPGPEHRYPAVKPFSSPRLESLPPNDPTALFDEIKRGDILVHHPYHSFDASVLHFVESATVDPSVLAIKLTLYRTSKGSPIVAALAEAARRGKQVAVVVEITASFDEAPNIAWGKHLERAGAHVSYGVESLKTHIKLAMVVREEQGEVQRYLHMGTGNYHTGTARVYEDLGILTCNEDLCEDAGDLFNALTTAIAQNNFRQMLVAPVNMRDKFVKLIHREMEHCAAGRLCGIRAKMNQLQDAGIVRELYEAGRAGVPISLNVRGLCALVPGLPGLSENIRVFSVVGRYLEHSRIYAFTNGGDTEYFLGSADWMKRNFDRRMEMIVPILDKNVQRQVESILEVYEADNASAWDCQPDGTYVRRKPRKGEPRRAAQEQFIEAVKKGLYA